MRFSESLAIGRAGECLISKWLQSRGHSIFPAYEIEKSQGKGPQLFSASVDLVLPDLLAFKDGKMQWFEAKHKKCFTWHRATQKWTTGLDIRHYTEYQEVYKKTKLPVWILFLHSSPTPSESDRKHGCPHWCPTGLFGNDLSILSEKENHRSKPFDSGRIGFMGHGKSGMVYWAHDSLRCIASVDELLLEQNSLHYV